jgi:DMSO reductase anchor subunit
MLVLTQMSVGAFLVEQALSFAIGPEALEGLRPVHALMALGTGLLALGASTFHLGRPLYAFRAVLGVRTSWMSREILCFGAFAALATGYALFVLFGPAEGALMTGWLGAGVAASGALGVFCSAMLYHDTRRAFWDITLSGPKFGMSMLSLGIPAVLVAGLLASQIHPDGASMAAWSRVLCGALIAVAVLKLSFEGFAFAHLSDLRTSPMRRSAALMAGALRQVTLRRFALGLAGGLLCPALLILSPPDPGPKLWGLAALMLLFSLAGELHERHLFFRAVVSPKMPGGVL